MMVTERFHLLLYWYQRFATLKECEADARVSEAWPRDGCQAGGRPKQIVFRAGGWDSMRWLIGVFFILLMLSAPAAAKGRWLEDASSGCKVWTANPKPDQEVRWSGKCLDGKATGRGKATWSLNADGKEVVSIYIGQMKDGKRHGTGSQYFADGARYYGEYQNNLPHGFGIYTSPDGGRYEGKYRNGKMHGAGVKTWPDGNWYEGPFVEDKMQGRGVYHYKNGNRYEGPFENGEMHGFGNAFYANGGRYNGPFVHDKMHGIGTCLRENDIWAKCEWEMGEFVRWLE